MINRQFNSRSIRGVNWGRMEDLVDLELWTFLASSFWLPERVPLADELLSVGSLDDDERRLMLRAFTGLTLLDTLQAAVGTLALTSDSTAPHKEAVCTNIASMGSVHTKSRSPAFSTVFATSDIDRHLQWSEENDYLQRKA